MSRCKRYGKSLAITVVIALNILSITAIAQVKVPALTNLDHPRLLGKHGDRASIQKLIASDVAVKQAYEQTKRNVDSLVTKHQTDSTWIVSRLQMYWKTKATDVYIKAGVYDHADGEAPVPTVKFPGARDNVSVYSAPKLADILPYMDDPRGVYLPNKTRPGQPFEWTNISKTGRILESINTRIMQLANASALLYHISGEEKYARFAFDLFDTYMTGMYYRKLPVDITHGHHQTITGLSTFEVIQEVAMLNHLTGIYDYMHDYLVQRAPQKQDIYVGTFKKWADVQVQNGVAFNNWNLMQARNILSIGSILDNNNDYKDGKGREYYIDQVINKNSERQWSITKLMNEGYDSVTGLWNESPGYSLGVLGDFTGFVTQFDRQFNIDILSQMGVLNKAVMAVAQYLFPNGYITSFGDSHYRRLTTGAAQELLAHVQKLKKPAQEESLTRYIKTIHQLNTATGSHQGSGNRGHGPSNRGLASLIAGESGATLKESIPAGKIEDYVTPVFYSEKVSYLALRNGLDPKNGLMVVMSGSKGNHMHAGGISMEIFGKGLVLGPESGIGTSYFQQDYAEYYSQFPAHNTVAVDGISAYPVMKSNHGFQLKSSYPGSAVSQGYFSKITFGEMSFIEPETMSDQNRLLSIIRTSDSTGYYIDIFRSKRKDGKDKMHDYFYHNIGQQLAIKNNTGEVLDLKSTDRLSFSGGHLFAYDYFWDKKSITTPDNCNAVFTLSVPGREDVYMNMWMKGSPNREIFSVKAPPSKAFGNHAMIPDSIAALPMPTIVARQSGEAWRHPFVNVFEPSTSNSPVSIAAISAFSAPGSSGDFVGLVIENKGGSKQYIFSSAAPTSEAVHKQMTCLGTYGVISEKEDVLQYLFLGNGKKISNGVYKLEASTAPTSAVLSREIDGWYFASNQKLVLTVPAAILGNKRMLRLQKNNKTTEIAGKNAVSNGKAVVSFNMPSTSLIKIAF